MSNQKQPAPLTPAQVQAIKDKEAKKVNQAKDGKTIKK